MVTESTSTSRSGDGAFDSEALSHRSPEHDDHAEEQGESYDGPEPERIAEFRPFHLIRAGVAPEHRDHGEADRNGRRTKERRSHHDQKGRMQHGGNGEHAEKRHRRRYRHSSRQELR